ncbi:MAG: hypothetical protein LBR21_09925 [Propionibacteriaceae bacterium]|jgi:hypothetical protein|nr:hypothetical protein [Propionibacteriaceae bacterium]
MKKFNSFALATLLAFFGSIAVVGSSATSAKAAGCKIAASTAGGRVSVWNRTCSYVKAALTYRSPSGISETIYGAKSASFSQTAKITSPCVTTNTFAIVWPSSITIQV